MKKTYSYVLGKSNITLVIDNNHYTFRRDSSIGRNLVDAISKNSPDSIIREIINVDKEIRKYVENGMIHIDNVRITSSTVYIDDEEIDSSLANQIRRHYDAGISIEPMVKFIQKVRKNPSFRIRKQLWDFINASEDSGGFTISPDGDIIAYKKVSSDYKDIHSHTFDNSVGQIISMNRSEVDDDPNNTCSSGLHFCAFSYLNCYATSVNSKIMIVKINPADVVSIPTDYGFAKGRCCRYEVIGELYDNKPIANAVYDNREITEEDIRKFASENTSSTLCELYRRIIGSDKPKKFETKEIGITRLIKAIDGIYKYSDLYDAVYNIIKG